MMDFLSMFPPNDFKNSYGCKNIGGMGILFFLGLASQGNGSKGSGGDYGGGCGGGCGG